MGKYLFGYSYGMDGGPSSILERAARSSMETESKEGVYTFELEIKEDSVRPRDRKKIRVSFWSPYLRAAQRTAEHESREMANGGWWSWVSFVPGPRPCTRDDWMETEQTRLQLSIRAMFPIGVRGQGASIEIIETYEESTDPLFGVRLVIWEDGGKFLSDVKEQWLKMPLLEITEPFLAALKSVMTDVLLQDMEVATRLPLDYFERAWSVLRLKTAGTMDQKDFEKALRQKSRLGRFLKAA